MESLIVKLKERLAAAQFQSESAVREAIVLPILQELGWDILDPTSVIRELSLGGRRVDYALSSSPSRKEVFIEVKAPGQSTGADRQLFEYAFHEGIPFAVLTDGREWNFFLPGEQGSYDDRRVQKLDIAERQPKDAAAIFKRYLDRGRVHSGAAIETARSDYKDISRRKTAANEIPKAWHGLLSEPDESLIDLISERTETLCGQRPAPEDVENFLISQVGGPVAAAPIKFKPSPKKASEPASALPASQRRVSYKILGKTKEARNATEALIDILHTFIRRDSQFLDKISVAVRARKRNHIAKRREEVYPLKPELAEYTTELAPGWWLGTNIANRDKMRIIKKACEVAGVTFGRDIMIRLPNAE